MENKDLVKYDSILDNQSKAIDYVRSNPDLVYYEYQNIQVPRVSKILDEAIGKNGLITWAARVGYKKMNEIKDKALRVGSATHELIEEYLTTNKQPGAKIGYVSSKYDLDERELESAITSFNNFKFWYDNFTSSGNTLEVIGLEVPVVCPWYGGTIDMIANINGQNFIIDFKTSKQISMEYLLQTCSYAWMVNSGYCTICDKVEGIGILRFDKTNAYTYDEYFLNSAIPWQADMLNQHTKTFWSIVNSFYNLMYSKDLTYSEYDFTLKGDKDGK